MRQIGTLPQEDSARKFTAHLLTLGIQASADAENDQWEIWVRDEDQISQAREELAQYEADPESPIYREAQSKANAIQQAEVDKAIKARENVIEVRGNWKTANRQRRRPLTIVLMLICMSVAMVSGTFAPQEKGESRTLAERALMFRDPSLPLQLDSERGAIDDNASLTFQSILRGEVWRLVTPIFLHGDFIHLLFNVIMLYHFGSMIEDTYGTWKFALMVFLFAIAANLLQAALVGPNVIGISGVVYGLFGFVWLKSIFEPNPRYLHHAVYGHHPDCLVGFGLYGSHGHRHQAYGELGTRRRSGVRNVICLAAVLVATANRRSQIV